MSSLARFWSQPTKAYRNSQIFFGVFTVGFGVASILYAALPGYMQAQFAQWDVLLGGSATGYPEPQNRIWIALAAGNVATLCLMSYLLMRDVKRNALMKIPLLFMKSASATLFVAWWVAHPEMRSLLVAAAGDFATAWGIWYFPRKALAELDARGDAEAVTLLASP